MTSHFISHFIRCPFSHFALYTCPSVSYFNEHCSLHTLLLSAPAIHRQSKFHGLQLMKLQLSYKIVWLCTEIANSA